MLNQKSIATPELQAKLATAHKIFFSFEGPEVAAIIAALEFTTYAVEHGMFNGSQEINPFDVINTNSTALQKIADAFDDEQIAKRMKFLLNAYTNVNS